MNVGIIGDGLISLTLAKALVNKDINVQVFFNRKNRNINRNRTIGLSKANIDYFNNNISKIEKFLWDIKKIKIFTKNFNDNELIDFENSNLRLFSIVQNYKLYNKLNIELKKSNKFTYKKIKNLNTIPIQNYDLIFNCEYNNFLTKKFFTNRISKNYESYAYVTIINHKKLDKNEVAFQIFTDIGPIAFLPISETETSVVYSIKLNNHKKNLDIKDLIRNYNPIYEINKINELSKFELKSSTLRKYYNKNILAFGELLHQVHPFVGQGFNMSIRDVRELMSIIDYRINLGLNLDSSVCIDFQNKMKDKNYIFSKSIDLLYEFFNFEKKINNNFFNNSVKLINKNKYIKNFFKNFADEGLRF